MADVNVSATDAEDVFDVTVEEGGRASRYQVTVPPDRAAAGLPDAEPERLIRESFDFLLEREPADAILARFSLPDIGRYFPEYPEEIRRRLR